MFTFEHPLQQKTPLARKKDMTERWHIIGKSTVVKTSPAFRIITVAIGILVAVLIAVTLWVKTPGSSTPESSFSPRPALPFTAKAFISIFLESKRPV